MTHVVYLITTTKDVRVYVGMSGNAALRFDTHRYVSKRAVGPLYDAMRVYGVETFSFEVVGTYPDRKAAEKAERALALDLIASGRTLFNQSFVVSPPVRKEPEKTTPICESTKFIGSPAWIKKHAIMLAPTKGSALEKVQAALNNDSDAMRSQIHKWAREDTSWATTFSLMTKASEQEGTND
jgi:predicted GIY-YIG superfamily endonuclease